MSNYAEYCPTCSGIFPERVFMSDSNQYECEYCCSHQNIVAIVMPDAITNDGPYKQVTILDKFWCTDCKKDIAKPEWRTK